MPEMSMKRSKPTTLPIGSISSDTMRHPLYQAAIDADAHYTQMLERYQVDRWGRRSTHDMWPAVKDAYQRKVEADAAWLAHMRVNR